jgi:hypothetical protein
VYNNFNACRIQSVRWLGCWVDDRRQQVSLRRRIRRVFIVQTACYPIATVGCPFDIAAIAYCTWSQFSFEYGYYEWVENCLHYWQVFMMFRLISHDDDNKFTYHMVFMESLKDLKGLLWNWWLTESRQISCFQRPTLLNEKLRLVIKFYVTSLWHKNPQYAFVLLSSVGSLF